MSNTSGSSFSFLASIQVDYLLDGTSESFYHSTVFGDDWFGNISPDNDDHVIDEGIWAYTPVPTYPNSEDDDDTSIVMNAYGLLRSRWNQNNVPYVTRYNQSYGITPSFGMAPTCYDHFNVLNQYSDWESFSNEIKGGPHGPLHVLVGGAWGADWDRILSKKDYNPEYISAFAGHSLARMWRTGVLTCPKYCSSNTPLIHCKCICPNIENYIQHNRSQAVLLANYANEFISDDYFYGADSFRQIWLEIITHLPVVPCSDEHGKDISSFLLRLFCNELSDTHPIQVIQALSPSPVRLLTPDVGSSWDGMGVQGDMRGSEAPGDIVFWPVHPTLDRLWHYRRILVSGRRETLRLEFASDLAARGDGVLDCGARA